MNIDPPAIAILGPTGVGKTETAVRLCQRFRGEVVSCDSVQVFRELNIGSGKPSASVIRLVPHHMINIYPPNYRTNVAEFKRLSEFAIRDIHSRRFIPFIVGGTGMYFNALYYGLFEGSSSNQNIRDRLMEQIRKEGNQSVYEKLCEVDPITAAKVSVNDTRRIVRALEVYAFCGVPLSQKLKNNKKIALRWLLIGLNRERKELYRRINERVEWMLKNGLIDETKRIVERFGKDAYALGSIGYRHCLYFLNGEWDYNKLENSIKKDTRRYAKRQITWFRKIKSIEWYHPDDYEAIEQRVAEFLASK